MIEKTNIMKQLDCHLRDSFSYLAQWLNGLSSSQSYKDAIIVSKESKKIHLIKKTSLSVI